MEKLFLRASSRLPVFCQPNQTHSAGVVAVGRSLVERLLGDEEELEAVPFHSCRLRCPHPSVLGYGRTEVDEFPDLDIHLHRSRFGISAMHGNRSRTRRLAPGAGGGFCRALSVRCLSLCVTQKLISVHPFIVPGGQLLAVMEARIYPG